MKMKTRLFTFTVLGIALAACTNDIENLNDGPVAAQFTAAIGNNVTATTRVSGTDGTKWDKGDCIGITCIGGSSYNNVPYVTNNGDGNFDPASDDIIYFDNTDEVTFRAYYPYKDDDEMTEGKIAATTDAKAQEVQTRHDFLFANGAKGSTYNPDVSFTGANAFSHCMSRITLNFKGGRLHTERLVAARYFRHHQRRDSNHHQLCGKRDSARQPHLVHLLPTGCGEHQNGNIIERKHL